MIELPDGKTEEDTARDGLLSYAVEWHALALGFLVGFAWSLPSKRLRAFAWATLGLDECADGCRSDAMDEIQQEPHYAAGGVAFGAVIGVFVQVVSAVLVVGGLLP